MPVPFASRGYLPHRLLPRWQFVTFRLADSLPAEFFVEWQRRVDAARDPARALVLRIHMRHALEKTLDTGLGACSLRTPAVADQVQAALLYFDDRRYRLRAWVVMPNHVHAVVELIEGANIRDVVASWKAFSGRAANRVLGQTGRFWQREYFDRELRTEDEIARAVAYTEANPVKAGLCRLAWEWPWSSASRRRAARDVAT